MKKTVSLALSVGGARGYAHIGVIEVLEEYGFQIKSIAGSSMGAVIGGIYAAKKLDEYKKWVTSLDKIDVWKMLDLSFTKRGIFKGDKIINFLERSIVGNYNIEDFEIKFTAVAVDIISHREVWLNKGSVFDAIRASIGIPGIFTPFYKDNKILVDGGILNPLPIAPVLNDNADLIIAVDVNSSREADTALLEHFHDTDDKVSEEMNMLNILMQSINIMQNKITKFKLASYSPNLVIEIPKYCCGIFDFHKAGKMIELGRIVAQNEIKKFLAANTN
jgi:NTE family protein